MSGYVAKVRALAWDSASRWLATGDREIVTLWDFTQGPPTGSLPGNIEGLDGIVQELAFQPGSSWLAAGDQSGGLAIWAVTDQQYQPLWQSHLGEGFQTLAWRPYGRWLAVGGTDGAVATFEFCI